MTLFLFLLYHFCFIFIPFPRCPAGIFTYPIRERLARITRQPILSREGGVCANTGGVKKSAVGRRAVCCVCARATEGERMARVLLGV